MLIYLIYLLSAIILLLLFVKYELGIALYVAYVFLVPLRGLQLGGIVVGHNVVLVLSLILFWIKYGKFSRDYTRYLTPFLFMYIGQALCIPFQNSVEPLSFQLTRFRVDVLSLLFPLIVLINSQKSYYNMKYTKIMFYGAIFISSLYCISLATAFGQNPYIDDVIGSIRDIAEENDQSVIKAEGLRIFGYISSCFVTVTSYGEFLIPAFVYVFYDYLKSKNKSISRIALILLFICIIMCGSRSVVFTLILTAASYLVMNRQFKIMAYSALLIFAIVMTMYIAIPTYVDFIMSVTSDTAAGSSTDMRMNQFMACLDELKENPLFGHGYYWTGWYISEFDFHPQMYCFESIIIQVLCNYGIAGVVIWTLFSLAYFRNAKRLSSGDSATFQCLMCLLFGYLFLTFFTGDFGGFSVMTKIYTLMICSVNFHMPKSNSLV